MKWFIFLLVSLVVTGCNSLPEGITAVNPPQTISDFTLTTQDNQPLHLSDLRGSFVLISFGYTHCPDVCPVTLAQMRRIQENLGEKKGLVKFVFISVDGRRDTPERLKQHLTYFSTDFIGLTGDEETLHNVIREYGGDFLINDGGGYRTENYSVDHTASKFLLDSEGQWVRTYGYNVDPDLIAEDLAQLLTLASSDTQ